MRPRDRGAGQWLGFALVALGAIMLSSKGILAKLLYAAGLDFHTVVATRSVLAVPCFLLLAGLSGQYHLLRQADRSVIGLAAAGGFACYYLGALANFYALTRVDASIERALLYTYPAIIVLALWVLRRQRPSAKLLSALGLTFLGIVLTIGLVDRDLPAQDVIGVLWILFCSSTIAFYFIITSRLTHGIGAANFTAIAMSAAGLAFLVHYELIYGWRGIDLSADHWFLMLVLVVFATVLPLFFIAEGLRRIGAQRAAIASTIAPASTVILAVTLLGESVSLNQTLGILLIIIGISVLELRRSAPLQSS